jgi:sugar (pentulose or hexulose) kinase
VGGLLIGIDVGTTWCKAVVLDPGGAELADARAPTPWRTVPTGAEADPEDLADAALGAAKAALDRAPRETVVAIGVAGMAETGVLLDARDAPVCPAIAWHDSRGARESAEIAATFGRRAFAMRTGLPASALCSLSKLRWQRAHVPGAARAVRWLGVPEWVAHRLGAERVAERSLASRTGMLDLAGGGWWGDAVAWLGAGDDLLPAPVQAGTPIGAAGDAIARARGAVLTVAGHDHLAAMVGAGAVGEGDVMHSAGTAEVFVRSIPAGLAPERVAGAVESGVTVGHHVVPGRWALVAGNEGDVALATTLRTLGVHGDAERDALTAAAGSPGAVEGRAAVWRAALEAGAERSAATLARIDAVGGPRRRIVGAGGGTRGTVARAIKEQRLGPIAWSPVQEATARGAGLLAAAAAGIGPSGRRGAQPKVKT